MWDIIINMKNKLLFLLLIFPILSQAAIPVVETAVVNSFKDYFTHDHHEGWEYGSIVVYKNGKYYHKDLLTDKKENKVYLAVRKLQAPDEQLVALYHVHPCNKKYWSERHSLPDVSISLYWGVPSFVLDSCTGNVHEYDEGIEGANVTQPIEGRIVGNIFN